MDKEYHILNDISSSGREIAWEEKKIKSYFVAKSFERIGYSSRSKRVLECGSFLEFKRFTADNSLKLNHANFCKVRLCPMCTWRRSLKVFGQVSQVMNECVKDKENQFLFLTLTVRNCKGAELTNVIDMMMIAYDRMMKRTKVKKAVLGTFRALEVTHNVIEYSENYDTYHPHFHVILMVNKSYFTSRDYIKQNEWVDMWQKSVDVDYKPIVHIEKIKNDKKNIEKAVAESAKYSVKDSDIMNTNDDMQDNAIEVLSKALHKRRLTSFTGEFKKIHKALNLDDAEEGDLINTDMSDDIRNDLEFVLERYSWHIGYRQYVKLDSENKYEVV